MVSVGWFVSLNGWNGVVTEIYTGTTGKKIVEIHFVKNVVKGQQPERYDWAMIENRIAQVDKSELKKEFNAMVEESARKLSDSFGVDAGYSDLRKEVDELLGTLTRLNDITSKRGLEIASYMRVLGEIEKLVLSK